MPKKSKLPAILTEEALQASYVEWCGAAGFEVLETNKGRTGGKLFCSLGIPDTFTTHKAWRRAIWLGIEFKRPEISDAAGNVIQERGKVRKEQAALAEIDRIVIVDTLEAAIAETMAFHHEMISAG